MTVEQSNDRILTSARPSRRALLGATAWSVPTIVVASAAPAAAVFSEGSELAIGAINFMLGDFPSSSPGTWTYCSSNSGNNNNGTFTSTTTVPSSTRAGALLSITVSGMDVSGSGSVSGVGTDAVTITVRVDGQITSGTARAAGRFGTISSGWTLTGTSLNGTGATGTSPRQTTFTFAATGSYTAPTDLPDLTFTVLTASTSGGTLYPWTATNVLATINAPGAASFGLPAAYPTTP